MSMFNDIVWDARGNQKNNVNTIHWQLLNMLANSLAVTGLSWGLDQKKSGTETCIHKPDGSWDRMAEENVGKFLSIRSSDISCFQCFCKRRITIPSREKEVNKYTLVVAQKPSSCFSKHSDFRRKSLPSSLRPKNRPMNSSGETYGKNTSKKSSNCQKTRSYPNCVLMRV